MKDRKSMKFRSEKTKRVFILPRTVKFLKKRFPDFDIIPLETGSTFQFFCISANEAMLVRTVFGEDAALPNSGEMDTIARFPSPMNVKKLVLVFNSFQSKPIIKRVKSFGARIKTAKPLYSLLAPNASLPAFPMLQDTQWISKRSLGDFSERWTKDYLSSKYQIEIIMTRASRSKFDLIGFSKYGVYLIQARSGSALKWPKKRELDAMRNYPAPEYFLKFVIRLDYFDNRPHLRNLADYSNIWRVKKSQIQRQQILKLRAENKARLLQRAA